MTGINVLSTGVSASKSKEEGFSASEKIQIGLDSAAMEFAAILTGWLTQMSGQGQDSGFQSNEPAGKEANSGRKAMMGLEGMQALVGMLQEHAKFQDVQGKDPQMESVKVDDVYVQNPLGRIFPELNALVQNVQVQSTQVQSTQVQSTQKYIEPMLTVKDQLVLEHDEQVQSHKELPNQQIPKDSKEGNKLESVLEEMRVSKREVPLSISRANYEEAHRTGITSRLTQGKDFSKSELDLHKDIISELLKEMSGEIKDLTKINPDGVENLGNPKMVFAISRWNSLTMANTVSPLENPYNKPIEQELLQNTNTMQAKVESSGSDQRGFVHLSSNSQEIQGIGSNGNTVEIHSSERVDINNSSSIKDTRNQRGQNPSLIIGEEPITLSPLSEGNLTEDIPNDRGHNPSLIRSEASTSQSPLTEGNITLPQAKEKVQVYSRQENAGQIPIEKTPSANESTQVGRMNQYTGSGASQEPLQSKSLMNQASAQANAEVIRSQHVRQETPVWNQIANIKEPTQSTKTYVMQGSIASSGERTRVQELELDNVTNQSSINDEWVQMNTKNAKVLESNQAYTQGTGIIKRPYDLKVVDTQPVITEESVEDSPIVEGNGIQLQTKENVHLAQRLDHKPDNPVWTQLAREIHEKAYQARPQIRELDIQLHPAELGQIRISLTWEEGQVHLRMIASEAGTGQVLQSHLTDLRNSLSELGIQCGMLEMGLGNQQKNPRQNRENEATPHSSKEREDSQRNARIQELETISKAVISELNASSNRINVTA